MMSELANAVMVKDKNRHVGTAEGTSESGTIRMETITAGGVSFLKKFTTIS